MNGNRGILVRVGVLSVCEKDLIEFSRNPRGTEVLNISKRRSQSRKIDEDELIIGYCNSNARFRK